MKTIFLAGALLLTCITTKTVAANENVTPVVLQSFQQTFFNATNVQWSVVDRFYKADFTADGEKKTAFFSMNDGTLVATARYITVSQLPRGLQNSLKTQAASGTIIELFEVQSDAGIDQYATVQKEGETIVLKAATRTWNVYKKS